MNKENEWGKWAKLEGAQKKGKKKGGKKERKNCLHSKDITYDNKFFMQQLFRRSCSKYCCDTVLASFVIFGMSF